MRRGCWSVKNCRFNVMEPDHRRWSHAPVGEGSLETRGITERMGAEIFTPVCALEVVLLCMQFINLIEFLSVAGSLLCWGGEPITAWRQNKRFIKFSAFLGWPYLQCQQHTSRCFQSHLNRACYLDWGRWRAIVLYYSSQGIWSVLKKLFMPEGKRKHFLMKMAAL